MPDLVPDPAPVTDPGWSAEPGVMAIAGSGSRPACPTNVTITPCGTLVMAPPPDSASGIIAPAPLSWTMPWMLRHLLAMPQKLLLF